MEFGGMEFGDMEFGDAGTRFPMILYFGKEVIKSDPS